jgi:hypothetical protein
MDVSRFDQSLNFLADAFGRRNALRSLGGAAIALLGAFSLPDGGDAKKKKGNKKKKCKGGKKKCGKQCIPSTNCCTDADCDGGSCVDGTCECLGGSKPCDGVCIPEEHCCTESDCDDGNPCTRSICNGNGTCSHPKQPDLTPCEEGKNCSGGICATYPACLDGGTTCITHADCCSNFCVPHGEFFGFCDVSFPGDACHSSALCAGSTCVGWVCTQ